MLTGAIEEALIRSVSNCAGLDYSNAEYIECNGTGIAIRDSVEAAALEALFGKLGVGYHQPNTHTGSLKINAGHLEGASGVVSLIKTALMLEKGFVSPNCDSEKLISNFLLWKLNMKSNTESLKWEKA